MEKASNVLSTYFLCQAVWLYIFGAHSQEQNIQVGGVDKKLSPFRDDM